VLNDRPHLGAAALATIRYILGSKKKAFAVHMALGGEAHIASSAVRDVAAC